MSNIYTLENLNKYIEEEAGPLDKAEGSINKLSFSDITEISAEEFLSALAITKAAEKASKKKKENEIPKRYDKFAEAVTAGRVSMWKLSDKQKEFFVRFLNDEASFAKLVQAAKEAEELLKQLEKETPNAVADRKNTRKPVIISKETADQYVDCNRRVTNYRNYFRYISYVRA